MSGERIVEEGGMSPTVVTGGGTGSSGSHVTDSGRGTSVNGREQTAVSTIDFGGGGSGGSHHAQHLVVGGGGGQQELPTESFTLNSGGGSHQSNVPGISGNNNGRLGGMSGERIVEEGGMIPTVVTGRGTDRSDRENVDSANGQNVNGEGSTKTEVTDTNGDMDGDFSSSVHNSSRIIVTDSKAKKTSRPLQKYWKYHKKLSSYHFKKFKNHKRPYGSLFSPEAYSNKYKKQSRYKYEYNNDLDDTDKQDDDFTDTSADFDGSKDIFEE
ncbi:unnamed protein product [Trichobilharzia regenti]|nr:unnamed protein product [Trichobilharzia regenti]